MKPKSFLIYATIFILGVLVVLLPRASEAVAQKPVSAGETISYSGRLSNDASQPVADGMYAFIFALYDAVDDGNLLWTETQIGVAVKDGAFTTLLGSATPLPKEARISKGWLAVSVRGPAETYFTALSPRQLLNTASSASPSSPAVGPSCPHDHFGELWIGNSAESPGNAGLNVQDNTNNGTAISGAADTGAAAWGVFGKSDNGVGVYGMSDYSFAMLADGNTTQSRNKGGWVKAMARVAGTSISRCYNSLSAGTGVSTPPCGFTSSGSAGTYTVDFGFQVNDRFISITPEWGSAGTPSAVVDSFPTANRVTVRLSANSAFFIIVY